MWRRFWCSLRGHPYPWEKVEDIQDHMAGIGWYRRCTNCGKWIRLR